MQLKARTIVGRGACDGGQRVLFTAGVHGDEYEPMAALRELAEVLDRSVGELRGRVTIVPVVNEPACRLGSRAADDGLDLARTCPGRVDGSVTERVAHALARQIADADFYIDLHTGGAALSILPLAGYMLHRDSRVLSAQRRMACAFGLPLVWGTSRDYDGRSLSVARDLNVPAIYVEHGGGGPYNCSAVEQLVAGCMGVLRELGSLPAENAVDRATPVPEIVEDARHGSGHLQANCPSPSAGFFTPVLGLGDRVAAGALIGSVATDPLGDEAVTVRALVAGRILMLRAIARVDAGDALAYVLPDDAPRVLFREAENQ